MTVRRFVPMLTIGLFTTPAFAQAPVLNQGVSAQDTLAAHNAERAKYPGVGPLQWSTELAQYAQTWTNRLATLDRGEHRQTTVDNPVAPGQYAGENIFWGDGLQYTGPYAVDSWSAEQQWYHYDQDNGYGGWNQPPGCTPPAATPYCGHFTQLDFGGFPGCSVVSP